MPVLDRCTHNLGATYSGDGCTHTPSATLSLQMGALVAELNRPPPCACLSSPPLTPHLHPLPSGNPSLVSIQYAKIVQKLGFQAKFTEFKIQNIVGSCDVRFPIRLEGLAFSQSMFSSVSVPGVAGSGKGGTESGRD